MDDRPPFDEWGGKDRLSTRIAFSVAASAMETRDWIGRQVARL